MCHQRPVALQGPSVLYVVYVVREHQNREVPEGSFIGDPLVLRLSGGVVAYINFGCQVELPSTAVLGLAYYLEAVTKIKIFISLSGVLP